MELKTIFFIMVLSKFANLNVMALYYEGEFPSINTETNHENASINAVLEMKTSKENSVNVITSRRRRGNVLNTGRVNNQVVYNLDRPVFGKDDTTVGIKLGCPEAVGQGVNSNCVNPNVKPPDQQKEGTVQTKTDINKVTPTIIEITDNMDIETKVEKSHDPTESNESIKIEGSNLTIDNPDHKEEEYETANATIKS